MTGGNIKDNIGRAAGVTLTGDCFLDMSGGSIGGNIGSYGFSGVIAMEGAGIAMSGTAVIEDDNKIILDNMSMQASVIIKAPITQKTPVATIDIIQFDEVTEQIISVFPIGKQVLVSGDGYSFTKEDVSKFVLADPTYGINQEGKIGERLLLPLLA